MHTSSSIFTSFNLFLSLNCRAIFLFLFLIVSVGTLEAQGMRSIDKVDCQLKLWIAEPQLFYTEKQSMIPILSGVDGSLVPVIFKSSSANTAAIVSKHHGELHSVIGPICTGLIPLGELSSFASESEIVRVESSAKVQFCNEKGRQVMGADKVNEGKLPSGVPYTGKGVLVGVYDSGLDFVHPDFRLKSDTTQTRITSMWDQTAKTGTKPQPYNYGAEWSGAQLNAALANPATISEKDIDGHGTHVTGTAAGLRGIAPDADIISVKCLINWQSDSTLFTDSKSILDGVNYFYQKATALAKPCVVNLSIGYNLGAPHDGSSLVEQGFDYLVKSRSGILICVANGNDGIATLHYGGFELTSDSVWTYGRGLLAAMMYSVFQTANEDSTFISIITDSLGVDDNDSVLTQKTIHQTPWLSLGDIRDSTSGITFTPKYSNNSTAATIKIVASLFDNTRTQMNLYMTPKNSTSYVPTKLTLFRIAFKGKGKFDAWSETLQIPMAYNPVYTSLYRDDRYRFSDNISTVNILACAKNVFSVGAFVNRPTYNDTSGTKQRGANIFWDSTGAHAFFTSWGPTTDGRIKPDFCAPGLNVASSHSRSAATIAQTLTDKYTVVQSGTSMASPMAAGAIALYLEKYPNATFDEVYSAITTTTDTDSLTNAYGPLPNSRFGYGRLNIFRAMGGIESSVSGNNRAATAEQISVYPDPATNEVVFVAKSQSPAKKLTVTDLGGKILGVLSFEGSSLKVDVRLWVRGAYFSVSPTETLGSL